MTIFAVNRSLDSDLTLDVDLRGFPGLRVAEALTLSNPDHTWSATADDATSVLPQANESAKAVDGRVSATLPPVSWTMLRLERA